MDANPRSPQNGRAFDDAFFASAALPFRQRPTPLADGYTARVHERGIEPHILVFDKSKRTGSQWTLRWREQDSNHWSLPRGIALAAA